MYYNIEDEGYEFLDFKLGQVVKYLEEEWIVIGFDEKADEGEMYLAITREDHYNGGYPLKGSSYVTSILKGHEGSQYNWVVSKVVELI